MTYLDPAAYGAPFILGDKLAFLESGIAGLLSIDPDVDLWCSFQGWAFDEGYTIPAGLQFTSPPFVTPATVDPLRLCNRDYRTSASDIPASAPFAPRLLEFPRIKKSIPIPNESGGQGFTVGLIKIANPSVDNIDGILSRIWQGARTLIKVGAPVLNKGLDTEQTLNHKEWVTIFDGHAVGIKPEDNSATITFRDEANARDHVITTTYAGTTGYEGESDLEGTTKPEVWGSPFNCEPVHLGDQIYQFDHRGLESLGTVRMNGLDLTNSGADADLLTAAPSSGTYVHDLSNGAIRIGGTITGTITADPVNFGAIGADILVIAARLFGTVQPTNISDYQYGYYITDQKTALGFIEELRSSVPGWAWYSTGDGSFVLTAHNNPTGAVAQNTISGVALESLKPIQDVPPVYEYVYQYGKNWTIQDVSNLDSGLSDEDRDRYSNKKGYLQKIAQSSKWLTSAKSITVSSWLTDATEVSTLASMEIARDSQRRRIWSCELPNQFYQRSLNEIQGFSGQRHDLDDKTGVIVSVDDNPSSKTASVQIMVYG